MQKLISALEKCKPSFIKALDEQLFFYMTIGSNTYESPMWMQLNPSRNTKSLQFENSQRRGIHFEIEVPEGCADVINQAYEYSETYDYFKYVKYVHIRDNYPTVWKELAEGHNGQRINNFLNQYQHG